MEIKGFIKEIGETGVFGNSGFKKRQVLIIEDVEKYPQTLPVDFVQDKCSVLDGYSEGELVTVSINLRGNDYNGKHYVNIQGWKIEREPLGDTPPAQKPISQAYIENQKKFKVPDESEFEDVGEPEQDDLPF